MRHLGAPLGVVVLLLGACSVINKFEEVVPEAAGGESSGGTSGAGGQGGNMNGGSSGSGTSGDGGAPPEGGTGGTAGDAGDAGESATGGTRPTGGSGGSGGTAGCSAPTTYFLDADMDTYGDDATTEEACEAPDGYVERGGDCDDDDDARNPGATEICNGLDENCDEPDEADTCPSGCMPQVVLGRTHLICRTPVNWTTAKTTCEDERMVLVRLRNSPDSAAIRNAMANAGLTEYWAGGTDGPTNAEEGTWRWLAGGDVFYPNTALFTNWASGQPATQFPVQDCLKVAMGLWYAEECQLTAPFICETMP